MHAIWVQHWDEANPNRIERDRLGISPVFYASTANGLWLSNDLATLINRAKLSLSPDLYFLSLRLADVYVDQARTPFQEVKRLPPAHRLVWDGSAIKITRYWQPQEPERLHYQHEHDYYAHLSELLQTVMADYAEENAGILASGGLDSSALLAFAPQEPGLARFTLLPDDAAADIPAAITALQSIPSSQAVEISVSSEELLGLGGRWHAAACIEEQPGALFFAPAYEKARQLGVDRILTGHGGDDVFSPALYRADYLQQGKWIRLFTKPQAILDSREWGFNWRFGLRPLLAELRHRILPQLIPRQHSPLVAGTNPFLNQMHQQLDQVLVRDMPQSSDHCRRQLMRRLFYSGGYAWAFEQMQALAYRYDISLAFPYFDWRLIEFSLALPTEYWWQQGWEKYILRRTAMRRVPEVICFPHKEQHLAGLAGKMRQRYLQTRSLEASRMRVVQHNLADPRVVEQILQDPLAEKHSMLLESLLATESWLEIAERGISHGDGKRYEAEGKSKDKAKPARQAPLPAT